MKRILIIIIVGYVVFGYYPSISQPVKNDLLRQSLKGNVKIATVKFYTTSIRPGSNYIYNKKKAEKIVIYTFNEYGNLKDITSYSPTGVEVEKMTYEYGENNKRDIIITTVKGKPVFQDSAFYDKDSNIAVLKRYNMEDSLQRIDFFTYNRNGNVMEMSRYDRSNILIIKNTFQYNDDGEMIGVSTFYNKENETHSYVFKFEDRDNKGNWIRRISKKNELIFQIMERRIEYY